MGEKDRINGARVSTQDNGLHLGQSYRARLCRSREEGCSALWELRSEYLKVGEAYNQNNVKDEEE